MALSDGESERSEDQEFSRRRNLLNLHSSPHISPTLSPGSLVGGFVLSVVGVVLLFGGFLSGFAILYTVGVLTSLIGTGFLIGFAKQLKLMFKPVRIVATIILIIAFAMVYVAAFAVHSGVSLQRE